MLLKCSAWMIGDVGAVLSSGGGFLTFMGDLPGPTGVTGHDEPGALRATLYCAMVLFPPVSAIALGRSTNRAARPMAIGIWVGFAVILTLPFTLCFLLIATVPGAIAIVFLAPPLYIGWLVWCHHIGKRAATEKAQ